MPRLNRVRPDGTFARDAGRGMFTGNRGILHGADGEMGAARWRHKRWICCALDHPTGRYHGPVPTRGWTALFFLDEAVALAAGHRPCFECRRTAARAYRAAYETAFGAVASVDVIDAALHAARATRQGQITHVARAETLPDGTFVDQGGPALVLGAHLRRVTPAGYAPPLPRPTGPVTVLTPAPSVAALGHGYLPVLHPSAQVS